MLAQMVKLRGISSQESEAQFVHQNHPHIELGRPGTPEEFASAVIFLAFEQASFINGENLRVNGVRLLV